MYNLIATSEIYNIVFLVKFGNKYGSSFFYKDQETIYLISAKHIFFDNNGNLYDSDYDIEVNLNGNFTKIDKNFIKISDKIVDIIIIKTNFKFEGNIFDNLYYGTKGMIFSQDVLFLGFPFLLHNIQGGSKHILPLVKKGIISGSRYFNENDEEYKYHGLYIDGHNNEGFSGGPVVIKNLETNKWQIIGVITGYKNDILELNGDKSGVNSGLFMCDSIEYVVEKIKSL